jgi:flagellar motor switch protein FliM
MMESKLLSLLTGELGSQHKVAKISADIGHVLSTFLSDLIELETKLNFKFAYDGCVTGLKSELIHDLDEFQVLVDGELKNWSNDFTIACNSQVTTAMVECMLGGDPDAIVEPESRPASAIELEMAPMFINKIAQVLKSAVNAPGNYEPILTKPYNAENRPKPDDGYIDMYATSIRMKVEFGSMVSEFSIIVPQKALLKTDVKVPMPAMSANRTPEGWAEKIQDKVRKSDVRVEARIHLTPLKLGTISRLQPGDVIPFLDSGDVSVEVSANGRELYRCEFGRSGEQYTVRVRDTAGTEKSLIQQLIG